MQFRTQISIEPFDRRIDHSQSGLMIGSCFTDHIGRRMADAGFRVAVNPFGVMFNPVSVVSVLERLGTGQRYTADDLQRDGERWFSYDFHGDFAARSAEEALRRMNGAVESGAAALQAADYVVLTLGTAWVYRLEGGRVAANCHKMPQRLFTRSRMSVEETVEVLTRAIEGPLAGRHVILTVSPVRHVGDGLAGNSLSKAVLRVAAGCLAERYEQVDYFPAFEILNDDLRDYRFYDADMVHPSPVAVQYVWEQWLACAVAPESQRPAAEAERLSTAMRHRPLDPGSEAHRGFCRSMLDRVERLEREYPGIDWSRWRRYFSAES